MEGIHNFMENIALQSCRFYIIRNGSSMVSIFTILNGINNYIFNVSNFLEQPIYNRSVANV